MKILVTTGPAHPLYFPIVPLAWALRVAGHEVLVAAPESFHQTVQGSGLPMVPVCGPLDMGQVMGKDRAGNPVRVPDLLLESCRALLDEPSYREQAQLVREEIIRQPLPGEMVAIIENLATKRKSV
jgi:UDP:flavonoid glycosyltransferase YjiC (YdhE family)